MIIIKLIGGLGNQLFQYAAGRCMAMEQKEELVLDISAFEDRKQLRKYSLSPFRITARLATEEETGRLNKTVTEKIISKLSFKNPPIISRKKFSFFPLLGKSHIILEKDDAGHWNHEKYFHGIENTIKEEITLREPQGEKYDGMLKKITECSSVSLHVRRADYLLAKHTNLFAECTLEYYTEAIKYISNKSNGIELFVFSDDSAWVKENLKTDYPVTFLADEHFSDYQELLLMASCKHNIIANSTFSWWGAWLNTNPNKIVVAPEKWFTDESKYPNDIIPSTWVKR